MEFEEKEPLLAHLKIHAGARSVKDSERTHKCPFCNKLFFTKKDVKRHLVVHTKDRDFLCQYCPQRCVSYMYSSKIPLHSLSCE